MSERWYCRCPFYRKDEKTRLFCLGYNDGTTIIVNFKKQEECKTHRKAFCQSLDHFSDCPVAQMILKEYEKV